MAWFKRQSGELETPGEKTVRTEGLWVKCEDCRQIIWKKDLEENMNVCPKCDKHFRIDARTRLAQLLDNNEYDVFDADLVSTDPLKFVDLKAYSSRLKQAQADTGLNASFAMLGDLNIAEPGALIGFAGPRVIEQTIRQKLPSGFQRSEFLLEHGMLDAVVSRKQLKPYLTRALDFMAA